MLNLIKFNTEKISKQESECLDMFNVWYAGATNELILKVNVKKWEYKLYGGRPEFYPEDRKAMITLLKFMNEKLQKDQKKAEADARIKEKMMMGGGGGRLK